MISHWLWLSHSTIAKGVPFIGLIAPWLDENKNKIVTIQKAKNINWKIVIYNGIKKAQQQFRTKSAAAFIIPTAK